LERSNQVTKFGDVLGGNQYDFVRKVDFRTSEFNICGLVIPSDLKIWSVYLCPQLHITGSLNLVKFPQRLVRYPVNKLLVYDHPRMHACTYNPKTECLPWLIANEGIKTDT